MINKVTIFIVGLCLWFLHRLIYPSDQNIVFLKGQLPKFQGFGCQMNLIIHKKIIVNNENQLRAALLDTGDSCKTEIQLLNKQYWLSSQISITDLNNILIIGPCTFKNHGITIKNSDNIILYNIRIYNTSLDGILVFNSSNVVLDSITVLDSSRTDIVRGKDIDITENSTNITISHSIIGYFNPPLLEKYKGILIANFSSDRVTNISVHHCLFYQNYQRSPEISTPGLIDFRNNVVYAYTVYGTRVRDGAYGNFMYNYYLGGKKDPLVFVSPQLEIYSLSNYWMYDLEPTNWSQIAPISTHRVFDVPEIATFKDKQQLKGNMKSWGCHGDSDSIIKFQKPIIDKVIKIFTSEMYSDFN